MRAGGQGRSQPGLHRYHLRGRVPEMPGSSSPRNSAACEVVKRVFCFFSGRSALWGSGGDQTQMGRLQRLPVLPALSPSQLPRKRAGLPLGSLCPSALCRDQPQLLGYKACRHLSREGILSRCGSQPWPLPPSHLGSSVTIHTMVSRAESRDSV